MGLFAALQGPPDSFAASSSPVDLARVAVWIEAALIALSKPGGVKDARGTVVPGLLSGNKSASKYLSNVFATLRGCTVEDDALGALKTLEVLLKMWCRQQEQLALDLVRHQKISWGEVLRKAAPMKRKKIKGVDTYILDPPTKPSKSPWLLQAERGYISHLMADCWSQPDMRRKQWLALDARDQHLQFSAYVTLVKGDYDQMNALSQAVHAKLGHRKKWILEGCEAASVVPRNKKDKIDSFKWSVAFFKLDLSRLHEGGKRVFSPAHYLGHKYEADTIYTWLCGLPANADIKWETCPLDVDKDLINLFKVWTERFRPNLQMNIPAPETLQSVEQGNIFEMLPVEEAP
jgi:hypothetical protein